MLQKCSGMKQVDSVIAGVMSIENQICKISFEIDVLVMDHTYTYCIYLMKFEYICIESIYITNVSGSVKYRNENLVDYSKGNCVKHMIVLYRQEWLRIGLRKWANHTFGYTDFLTFTFTNTIDLN